MSATLLNKTIGQQQLARRAGWLSFSWAQTLEAAGRHVIRYGLVLVLVWIGGMKFTAYEAEGISGFVSNSPLMFWAYQLFSKGQFSVILGSVELLTAGLIAARPFSARLSAVGSALAVGMFLTTLTFLFSTPGVVEPSLGFPALSAMPGQFLIKDFVLLGAALWTAGEARAVGSSGTLSTVDRQKTRVRRANMSELLDQVLQAHGSLDRWKKFHKITATIVGGGGLWPLKGVELTPGPREMTALLHEEWASVSPFGQAGWHSVFKADRVTIETAEGEVIQERTDPRASFTGHVMNTPWDPLHLAYFNGYAMWTYLTTPFFMAMPGFTAEEISPWQEGNERWRGLRVRFPDYIASHSPEQDFYFGDDFLLRRHDYHVDVAGGFAAAQYVHDHVEASGLRFPTKRLAYVRGPDRKPIRDLLLVSIDLGNFRLT